MNITNIKEEYIGNNKNEFYKIKGMPIKINLLKEQLNLPRIKVNMKKINDIKNQKAKINKKIIININKINEFNPNPKKINNNSFCNKTYNNLNNNIKNNSINKENKNKKFYLRNIDEEITYNKNNSFKVRKINLTKNKDQFQQLNYIINSYENKLATYNTSIQFNNNNINIINSSDNRNNIIYNLYKTSPFNKSNNTISDYLHNTPYEQKLINEFKSYNGLKKNSKKFKFLLNKNNNYFSSINDNKRKQYLSKKLLSNSIAKTNYLENSNSKYNTSNNGLNSERLTTPFNLWKNNKIYPKNTLRKNNSIEKKYKTLTNNVIKQYKKGMNYTKNNSIRNSSIKTKILNITNKSLTKSTAEKENSFKKGKIFNKMFQNLSYIKKEYKILNDNDEKKNTIFTNNSNIHREYFVKKIFKKTNDKKRNIKEFKDRRIKRIITESNEAINKIKNEFLKKLEKKMPKKQ